MYKKTKMGLAVASAALLLSGCGGGGSDSSSGQPNFDGAKVTISGRAADGYLVQANVCADLNNNSRCDGDEPMTTTGPGGVFDLSLSGSEVTSKLLVEAIQNLTVDEDTGQPVTKGYTMRGVIDASKDEQFVSPITSMVVDEMERGGGTSLEKAKQKVTERLNTSFDVMADFVAAAEGDSDESQNAERLHRIAQLKARFFANIESEIDQSYLDKAGMTKREIMALFTSKLDGVLTLILRDANDSMGDSNFDPDSILENPDYGIEIPDLDLPDLEEPEGPTPQPSQSFDERLAEATPETPFFRETPSGLQSLSEAKSHEFYFTRNALNPTKFHYVEIEQGVVSGSGTTAKIESKEHASRQYSSHVGSEYVEADSLRVHYWNGERQVSKEMTQNFFAEREVEAAGGTLTGAASGINTSASYMGVDLSGVTVGPTLVTLFEGLGINDIAPVAGSVSFHSGAKAFVRSETLDNDLYVTSWPGLSSAGNPSETTCSPNANITVVESCNVVYGNESTNGFAAPAKTLDGLMFNYGDDAANGSSNGIMGFEQNGITYGAALFGQMTDGSGDINIYKIDEDHRSKVATGEWELVFEPFTHVRLNLPDGMYYPAFMSKVGGQGYAFLHEDSGYVRAGRFTPKGTEVATYFNRNPDKVLLNQIAAKQITELMDSWDLLIENPGWSSVD